LDQKNNGHNNNNNMEPSRDNRLRLWVAVNKRIYDVFTWYWRMRYPSAKCK